MTTVTFSPGVTVSVAGLKAKLWMVICAAPDALEAEDVLAAAFGLLAAAFGLLGATAFLLLDELEQAARPISNRPTSSTN
ncbi:hypothetical protein [Streptacidiphilus sp. P02-A3a]|uniref:hypothetical protein n=1 Tax=Streptacidiphilus sp. P02-A3a TaxID=2704468 RepID=UPI001CDD61D6|nr:hypothetical protein [Streptacidiphilus sp. P02-A3a]